jgi:hypothetical protein
MRATQQQYQECVSIYSDDGRSAVYAYAKKKGIDKWSYCNQCEDYTPDCENFCCLVCETYKVGMDEEEVVALQSLRAKGYAIAIWYPHEHGLDRPERLEDDMIQRSWDIIEILKEEELVE